MPSFANVVLGNAANEGETRADKYGRLLFPASCAIVPIGPISGILWGELMERSHFS